MNLDCRITISNRSDNLRKFEITLLLIAQIYKGRTMIQIQYISASISGLIGGRLVLLFLAPMTVAGIGFAEGVMIELKSIENKSILGVSKTSDSVSHVWSFDYVSGAFSVLFSDEENDKSIHSVIPGSCSQAFLWSSMEIPEGGVPEFNHYLWINSTLSGKAILSPNHDISKWFRGLPRRLLGNGQLILSLADVDSVLTYSLWDVVQGKSEGSASVLENGIPLDVSQEFGPNDNLILTYEIAGGDPGSYKTRFDLFQLEPFERLATFVVKTEGTVHKVVPGSSDLEAIVAIKSSHIGFSKLSIVDNGGEKQLGFSEIDWLPGHKKSAPNWQAGYYIWATDSGDSEVALTVTDDLSSKTPPHAVVPIEIHKNDAWSWSYGVSSDGRLLVTSGGKAHFDLWNLSTRNAPKLGRYRIEYENSTLTCSSS